MTWNLKKLLDDVEDLRGKEQRELLAPSLKSIGDRLFYCDYHFQEAERLMAECLADKTDTASLFRLVLGSNDEQSNFRACRIRAEAHIVACLQSMHSVTDILGHAIYYALGMNLTADLYIPTKCISIYKVNLKVKQRYSPLANLIDELITHVDYKYLSDLVNHSKHRSIIGVCFWIQPQGDRHHGLQFSEFSYEKRTYQGRWIDDFLGSEYSRQNLLVIRIGNELNETVKNIISS